MTEIKPFKDQDYALLKSQHNASNLFVDPIFPANTKSIAHTGKSPLDNDENDVHVPLENIQWKRPKEVFANPQFVIDGYKRSDLNQGSVSNCWFIAACAAVTLHPDLLARVIPQDQSFDEENYTGMFHFRFWLSGNWYDIVVDDRLPFYQDELIYCRNAKDPNELWPALIEKAYAKVCGSYESMNLGHTTDALIDMTAGVDEAFEVFQLSEEGEKQPNFKERIKGLLHQGYAKKSMLGCHINPDPSEQIEAAVDNGLFKGHAYSITRVKDVTTKDGQTITLIRMRNPWGGAFEWKGDWSDNSKLWDTLSDKEKAKLKYQKRNDGEFWMSFDDFFSNFHSLNICHRGPSSLETSEVENECIKWSDIFEDDQVSWKEEVFHGEWIPGKTAGGWLTESDQEKFFTNPQYLIKLTSTDDVIFSFDDDDKAEYCTAIISLMQKNDRERIANGEQVPEAIGFVVCKVKDDVNVSKNIENGNLKFYADQLEIMEDDFAMSASRSVTKRCRLSPGTYIIIPSTRESDEAAKFLLRIFTEKEVDQTMKAELDRDKENLTKDDVTFTEKEFTDLIDGFNQLLDEFSSPSSNTKSKKSSNSDAAKASQKKPTEKEELCSIQ